MSRTIDDVVNKKGRERTSKGDIPLSYTKEVENYFNTMPYARQWLNSIVRKRGSSIRSQQSYIACLVHVSKVTGIKDFRQLTFEEINNYDTKMWDWGMAPRTRRVSLSVVNSILQYSEISNLNLVNRINKELRPREPKDDHRRYLSDIPNVIQIWNDYIDTQKNKYNKFVLRLLTDYGLREEELVTRNLEDFDIDNYCIHVVGKGNKYRKIEFIEGYEERIIKAYYQYLQKRKTPINIKDENALLVSIIGTRPVTKTIRDFVNHHTKKALGESFSPHKIRHFTASWQAILRDTNGNLLYEPTRIMKFLGHESLDTTTKYIHTFAKRSGILKSKMKNKLDGISGSIEDIIKNCPPSDLPKLVIRLHLQGKITDNQLDKYMTILNIKNRN
jgi:site-specific recombinase XerC